ncbi:hypothetical protein [Halopseudomonas xiamenensis]
MLRLGFLVRLSLLNLQLRPLGRLLQRSTSTTRGGKVVRHSATWMPDDDASSGSRSSY